MTISKVVEGEGLSWKREEQQEHRSSSSGAAAEQQQQPGRWRERKSIQGASGGGGKVKVHRACSNRAEAVQYPYIRTSRTNFTKQ
jgi:hypothetical protein